EGNMAKRFIPLEKHTAVLEKLRDDAEGKAERFETYAGRNRKMAEQEGEKGEWRVEIAQEQEGMARGFEKIAREIEDEIEESNDSTYGFEYLGREVMTELLVLVRKYPEMRNAITDYTLVKDYGMSVEEVAEVRQESEKKIDENVGDVEELLQK
ncbi:MAG: hypothetical protein SXQ77_13630, partial [Halobacteria archaeon]|nr:hypothetical protein [Halobacteria archaeon]